MARHDETGKVVGNQGRTRRRWPRRLVGTLVVLGGLVWLAPVLIAHTPLAGWLARRALADLRGSVRIGGASLGWLSPPVLQDVEVCDAAGAPLLLVPRLEGSRSLLGLVWDSTDLGTFRAERPALTLVCTRETMNLEQVLAHWLEPAVETAPTRTLPAVRIELVDAKVTLRDDETKRQWDFEDLGASVTLPRGPRAPVHVQVRGSVREGEQAGHLDAELSLESSDWGVQGEFKTDLQSFPLAVLTPLARRVEMGMGLAGTLSAKMEGKWGQGPEGSLAAALRGQVSGRGLEATGLGTDRARLDRLEASCDATLEGGRLLVRKAEASCDLGTVSLAGTFAECADLPAYLDAAGQSIAADLDLVRLTELLRCLVPLEEDARLTSGRLGLRIASTPQGGGTKWEGHLRIADLKGERGKEAIAWQEPVSLDFRLTKSPRALPVIQECRCDSGFLRIGLEGNAEQLAANITFDLDRLGAQLAPILDLESMRPGGCGTAQVTLRRTASGGFQAHGQVDVRRVQIPGLAGGTLREEGLTVRCQASGTAGAEGLERLDAAGVRLEAGDDFMDVQLREPVAQPTRGPWGRLRVRAGGDLERWLARARPWVPAVADLQVAGAADLDARVRPDAQGVDLEECSLAVNNLVAGNSRDAAWREPRLRLTARGRLETASDIFKIEEVRLETSVLTATAAGQLAHLSESRDLALSGKLQYDLQQLEPHLRPFLGQGVQVRGQAVRPFRLQGPLAGGPGAGVAVQVGNPDPLAGLTGEASLGWSRAQAYGCDVGPGNLKADLGGGWLRVQPIEATVNQGRLHLDPSVRLDPGPAEMFLGKGTSVDHFRLTPAACASALGYALPGLANVLEAEGEVSVALEAARVPLAAPAAAEITGKIVIHSGRIGPGSLVRELGTLLAVPGGASLARESVVPFRMANGRIYHSDLDLVFPELTIRTQGSVGLDGSLDLVAETTVPPKWVGGKVGKLLGGQPVRLPIRGTLASPKIDERALRAAMEQAAREIGEGAIRHELEKGLQDLFKPRK